jgi:AraC family transcriptional activator of pobA
MSMQAAIAAYYQRYGHGEPATGHVTAYRLEERAAEAVYPHVRRDFYKIKLLCDAEGILSYADQRVAVRGCALIFVNPLIPYAWERTAGRETGFACLFTEAFSTPHLRTASVAQSPLFRPGSVPVLFPPPAAIARIRYLFEQLLAELPSAYAHKYEVLRTYVQLLLHESLKLLPAASPAPNAAIRLQGQFLDLLGRQFPLTSPTQLLVIKTATEFARQLGVHPTHLNKVLQATTGHSAWPPKPRPCCGIAPGPWLTSPTAWASATHPISTLFSKSTPATRPLATASSWRRFHSVWRDSHTRVG